MSKPRDRTHVKRSYVAERQKYRIIPIPGSTQSLVYGLTWQTVLGQDLAVAALKTARTAQATHYVQTGARSPAVGWMRAHGKDRRIKSRNRLYSAAAALSQLHRHGTHVAVAALPRGEVWLTVVVDGVVQTDGDRVLASTQEAQDALAALRLRFPDMQLHAAGIEGAVPFSVNELAPHTNGNSAVRRAAFKLSMVSPSWWVALGVCLAYLAWDAGQAWWRNQQALERARQAAQHPTVDPAEAWQDALQAWAHSERADGQIGLQLLLHAASQIPLHPGRWRLVDAGCELIERSCQALYYRTRLADTHTLKDALPQGWRYELTSLDTATVRWRFDAAPAQDAPASSRISIDELPSADAMRETWMASWQALRPAVQTFTLGPSEPLPIRPPNMRLPNGLEQPIEKPPSLIVPSSHSLEITGPLRSLYGLALPPTTKITAFRVFFQPDAAAGLVASQLSAAFTGVIYVR